MPAAGNERAAEQSAGRLSAAGDRGDSPSVVVTGAAGGIGTATVGALVRRGARVLAVDVDDDGLAGLAAEFESSVVAHRADVGESAEAERMITTAVREFGRLDGLFNNAGIVGVRAPVSDYPDDEFDRVYRANVRGVFLGMKYGVPAMLATGGGAILNAASTGAMVGASNMAAYISSKHAVLGLTRTVALEVAALGITVNAMAPGTVDTPMVQPFFAGLSPEEARERLLGVTPTGRIARPAEIAAVATWLLLDSPSYLTGALIPIDGAQTAQAGTA
jgi:NAD(P)-dependent dehydrogenase (short-subunit alcohol dehydrogenase family)